MTSPSMSPAWLRTELREHPSRTDPQYREEEPIEVLPGDVLVVGTFDDPGSRGHLLIAVDSEDGWFKGMLANAQTELATDVDAILPPALTGLGYEVTAHTRFHGPLWTVQVRRRVGAVEMSTLDQLEKLSWNDEPNGVTLRRGQPLQPEGIDPRFPPLRSLSIEFDRLTEHYRRRCHDLTPILDPFVGEVSVLNELLHEPGWGHKIKSTSISQEFCDYFLNSYPQLSPDEQRAAQLIGEQAQRALPSRLSTLEPDLDISGHKDKVSLAIGIAQIQEVLPFIEVLTHSKCWNQTIPSCSYKAIESDKVVVSYTSLGEEPIQEVV